jgi:aminoglycoside 6-adenylyltransferase
LERRDKRTIIMRTEAEILELIIGTAQADERIRGAILNGSRANPNARRDRFQDFDIVYLVTEVDSLQQDPTWIDRFGELMILQLPETMLDPPPEGDGRFTYLMQFTDGNRIDLSLMPIAKRGERKFESLSMVLLDKNGLIGPLPAANDGDYLPTRPTAKAFFDCCNEFWWVCPNVAKGLWREEIIYAKHMLDVVVRAQLTKMLVWYAGIGTGFKVNLGIFGKNLPQHLEPELGEMLWRTYSDAGIEHTWDELFAACDLFRITANRVAQHFGFNYSTRDDERVTTHLQHVRSL